MALWLLLQGAWESHPVSRLSPLLAALLEDEPQGPLCKHKFRLPGTRPSSLGNVRPRPLQGWQRRVRIGVPREFRRHEMALPRRGQRGTELGDTIRLPVQRLVRTLQKNQHFQPCDISRELVTIGGLRGQCKGARRRVLNPADVRGLLLNCLLNGLTSSMLLALALPYTLLTGLVFSWSDWGTYWPHFPGKHELVKNV